MIEDLKSRWDLDPAVAHLNHGSYGAVPRVVAEAQDGWRLRAQSNPMQFFARDIDDLITNAREAVAPLLGCDADGFAFVANATAAANVVMSSIALAPGDRILTTDHAYGAVRMTLKEGARRAGAFLDVVPIPLGSTDVCDRIVDAVTPETRFAVIDHITSATATIFPIHEIVPALRDRDIIVFVDAAHAPGMVDVDVTALGASFWATNFHKWMCGPTGSGGLWVAPEHRAQVQPLVTSWRAGEGYPNSFGWWGTQDFSAYLTVPQAFAFIQDLGRSQLEANHSLVTTGTALVREAIGAPSVTGRTSDQIGSMDLALLPQGVATTTDDAKALSRQISESLKVEAAVVSWNGIGLMRLSAHAYNTLSDFERLADGLPKALMERS